VPIVAERLVATADDAVAAAGTLGYPVAVKICAAAIAHKSEHGLVQRMAPARGVELVLGARRDRVFGPVVMVGLGGVFVEHLNDVAFGLAPLTRERAARMLASLRAYPLLTGARGRPAVDEEAVIDALVGVGSLAFAARDRLAEIDVNPLIALPRGEGALAVDALLVIEE
jgi:acyl-CoA synthetase (NDP forming)